MNLKLQQLLSTLSPDHRSTVHEVILRIISTLFAIAATFILAIILVYFNLGVISPALAILSFMLYYVYEEDYPVAMFFLISGIILLKHVTTISETIEEEVMASCVAFIIILFANYCILPSKKDNNITKLITNKITLTGEHIKNLTQNKEDVKLYNFELYDLNNIFNNAIDRFESYYEVGDDLNYFKDISKALDNLVNVVLFIPNSDQSSKILTQTITNYFSNITKLIRNETDVVDMNDDFSMMKEHIEKLGQSEDTKVLSLKYRNVLTDLEYINDSIMNSKRKDLFSKYNEDL